MTRKRFIKLLMANGYSRNEAHKLAKRVPLAILSYQDIYTPSRPALIFRLCVGEFSHNARKAMKAFSGVASALAQMEQLAIDAEGAEHGQPAL